MSFNEHLQELRKRFIRVLLFFFAAIVFAFLFSKNVLLKIMHMGEMYAKFNIVYTSPFEIVIQQLQIAVFLALIISIPFTLYEITLFVFPALTKKEKKIYMLIVFSSIIMGITGSVFSIKVIIPFVLKFVSEVGNEMNLKGLISMENYMQMLKTFIFIFACVFELPGSIIYLDYFNIIKVSVLCKIKKFIILFIFILSAIITPPDVVSQCMVAVPMILLIEISIIITKIINRFGRKRKCQ